VTQQPDTNDGLQPFCILLRWGERDEGEYGYSGRHKTSEEAIKAAREEMFWLEKTPEDYPELFDESGEPISDEELAEVRSDAYDYEVIEVNPVNVYAAGEALDALRLALSFMEKMQPYEGADKIKTEAAITTAIARLECRA
jgi:hypothetical protein